MVPSHLTALSVSEYMLNIRLTGFGSILRRARILQSTYRFTEPNALRRFTSAATLTTEVTRALEEGKECQDAIHGRVVLGCETRLLVALVSEKLSADLVDDNSCHDIAWHKEEALLYSWV